MLSKVEIGDIGPHTAESMVFFFADRNVFLLNAVGLGGKFWRLRGSVRVVRWRRQWFGHVLLWGRRRYLLMHSVKNDQHLISRVWRATQRQVNLLHELSGLHGRNRAHGEALRENAIFARSVEPFTGSHLFLVLNEVHQAIRSVTLKRSVNVAFLRFHADGKGRIRHEQYLRRQWIFGHDLAHNAVGSDDGHPRFNTAG